MVDNQVNENISIIIITIYTSIYQLKRPNMEITELQPIW